MKKKINTVLIIAACVFACAAAVFGFMALQQSYAPRDVVSETQSAAEEIEHTPTPTPTPALERSKAATMMQTPEPYISPVDFDELRSINSDIYAWILIDDTNIDYPVVQSSSNDAYYLNHNSDGAYSANGAIFSEHEFNGTDFTDPVTILYGHHSSSGAMFGQLQQYYSDDEFWSEDHKITIYMPDKGMEYAVFAAVPYSSEHILYYNNFQNETDYEAFFSGVMNTRELGAHINEAYAPEAGDQVLILSTCLIGNNTNRYLVMGKLIEESVSTPAADNMDDQNFEE